MIDLLGRHVGVDAILGVTVVSEGGGEEGVDSLFVLHAPKELFVIEGVNLESFSVVVKFFRDLWSLKRGEEQNG